jgi:hypothetical protein
MGKAPQDRTSERKSLMKGLQVIKKCSTIFENSTAWHQAGRFAAQVKKSTHEKKSS